ncbi:MAG: glycosyltransferase [Bacillota bacterium]|nr:glycosyltransferase [Bacillota bacterium]
MGRIRDFFINSVSFIKDKFHKEKNDFKVSTVVLGYNGGKYLRKRLESIINQSLKPYEIIYLDDASTDDSLKIAKSILKKSKIKHKIIVNKKNMGCGSQIIKGLNTAKGDFIWFTEQDDYSSIAFLTNIRKLLADSAVNLAFCKSEPLDVVYRKLSGYPSYSELPNEDYLIDGSEQIESLLCVRNTILDLSSAVFRKAALEGIETYISKCKIFYDWIMYAYVLKSGKVGYCSKVLNYHLRHPDSIMGRNRQNPLFYEDVLTVKNFIVENFKLSVEKLQEMLDEVKTDYESCGCIGSNSDNISEHPFLGRKYNDFKEKVFRKIAQITTGNSDFKEK